MYSAFHLQGDLPKADLPGSRNQGRIEFESERRSLGGIHEQQSGVRPSYAINAQLSDGS